MKCKEVKYFRSGDDYYVALGRESCINFILQQDEDLYYSEIDSVLEEVPSDTVLSYLVYEELEYKGLTCYAEFRNITLKECYENLHDKDSGLPLQIVFDL